MEGEDLTGAHISEAIGWEMRNRWFFEINYALYNYYFADARAQAHYEKLGLNIGYRFDSI